MKKFFSILLTVSLVLCTLMAQPITEQQKLPLQERIKAFDAAVAKDAQFALDVDILQKQTLLHYIDRNRSARQSKLDNPVYYMSTYEPLMQQVLKVLVENSYDRDFITSYAGKIVGDIEKGYYGIEFTSEIPDFDKIYNLVSSNGDFNHIMEDEVCNDIKHMLNDSIHAELWDAAAIDFASYARSRGFYFTQDESKELLIGLFEKIIADYDHSFEERAEDFFRVMSARPDFVEDLQKFNDDMVDYLASHMGDYITAMTDAEFYETPILTEIDNILLSEGIDVDNQDFGAYIEDMNHAFKDEGYVSSLPKFDEVFEKIKKMNAFGEVEKIGSKKVVSFILKSSTEEQLAEFGANFAEYAASKGFYFSNEEAQELITVQLQNFLAN